MKTLLFLAICLALISANKNSLKESFIQKNIEQSYLQSSNGNLTPPDMIQLSTEVSAGTELATGDSTQDLVDAIRTIILLVLKPTGNSDVEALVDAIRTAILSYIKTL